MFQQLSVCNVRSLYEWLMGVFVINYQFSTTFLFHVVICLFIPLRIFSNGLSLQIFLQKSSARWKTSQKKRQFIVIYVGGRRVRAENGLILPFRSNAAQGDTWSEPAVQESGREYKVSGGSTRNTMINHLSNATHSSTSQHVSLFTC